MAEVFIFDQPLSLGQKIRIARIARRWTQDDLAEEALVAQHQVSALERDLPVYPSARQRILKILGLNGEGPADG